MGGYIFDLTGTYANAFLAAFGFTVINFCTIGLIYLRQTRLGLNSLPTWTHQLRLGSNPRPLDWRVAEEPVGFSTARLRVECRAD